MRRITIIILVAIGTVLSFTGCSSSSNTSSAHAYQNYIALKAARLEREAAGNYTGYEKGTAEYIRRSSPKYIAAKKKRLKKAGYDAEAIRRAMGNYTGYNIGSAEHKAYLVRLNAARLKREQAERDPAYIARINKVKNANRYKTSSYSTNSSSQSTKEGLNALNRQLNQMNNNMAKRSYYTPSNNSNPSNYRQSSSASSSGYRGDSGAKYQYDSSKYEDQIRYQYDYNAQHRDRMYKDYSGNRDKDTSGGQYGTGIYGQ